MPRPAHLFSVLAVLLVGCTQPTLVGKWESGKNPRRTVELSADGKVTMSVGVLPGAMLEGGYKVQGNRIKVTGLKLVGPPGLPALAKGHVPEGVDATFSWKNDREIVITGDRFLEGGYKRVK